MTQKKQARNTDDYVDEQKCKSIKEALKEIFPSPYYGAPSKDFFDNVVIALVEADYIDFDEDHPHRLLGYFVTAPNKLDGEDHPRLTVEFISIPGEVTDGVPQIDIFFHVSQKIRVVYGKNFIMRIAMEIEDGRDNRFKWGGDGSTVSRLINILEVMDKTCEYFFSHIDSEEPK